MSGKGPVDVLGENEALQQFFNGQDISGVLDNAVVDTSILEQYLSNEIDPTFMLPESPPDSGSEPCSPPQVTGYFSSNFSTEQVNPDPLTPAGQTLDTSCYLKRGPHEDYRAPQPIKQMKPRLSAVDQVFGDKFPVQHFSPVESCTEHSTCLTQPVRNTPLGAIGKDTEAVTSMDPYMPFISGQILPERKKRRHSKSFDTKTDENQWEHSAWNKHSFGTEGRICEMSVYDNDVHGVSPGMGVYQLLSWEQYQPKQWRTIYNINFQTLPRPAYHVDTDKGFSYSAADEAFVCQKKNHFQVTVHIGVVGEPKYVETPEGPMPIDSFEVKVFGVKMEAQKCYITIEQSQTDRSKKTFLPVQINLPGNKITKITLGRLHFSETTANNMRKKGKPNPDQRYFLMVVGLYATVNEKNYLLVANISERIIVRASNPGQFENDSEVLWQKGPSSDSVVCHGQVGINTDAPDEALVVCGNAKIMGTVMHPSDRRAKLNIQEVDSSEQLRRIAQMKIVEYDYKPEFASKMGINQVHETGIIAQEVRELLPSAVREVGDVTCSDGQTIHEFLMVDKEQIFMENVGAVKQLCKLTDNLETRIQELEVWNSRLAKLRNLGSGHSKSSADKRGVIKNKTSQMSEPSKKPSVLKAGKECVHEKYQYCLQQRLFQATIILLVATMAFCAICITTLYMLTLREDLDIGSSTSNSSAFPLYTSTEILTTVSPTSPSGSWPPDIDFSSVYYSEEVYCCLQTTSNMSVTTSLTVHPRFIETLSDGKRRQPDKAQLKQSRHFSDWTNTTIQAILITQNQQVIDDYYINQVNSRKGNYSYLIPISKHIPINMPVTLQMNTTELLVVHLCGYELREECTAVLDYSNMELQTVPNTQGYVHKWPLSVSRHFRSYYHFRVSVAGQADCLTDPNYAEILFTDYHFHFYRRCQ